MSLELKDNLPENTGAEEMECVFGPALSEQADTQNAFAMGEGASDEETARSMAHKQGVDFIDLSTAELSPHVVHLVPRWLAVEHTVIAVKFEEDTLYLAIANPLDLPTLEQVRLVTGFNVKPVAALDREIRRTIGHHYDIEQMSRQDFVDARFNHEKTEQTSEDIEASLLMGESGQSARLINTLLINAVETKASDIHLEPTGEELIARFRVDGILHDIMRIPAATRKEVLSRIKILANLDITEKRRAQDGHITFRFKENNYDLRVSVVPTISGGKTVIRILNKNSLITDFTQLGLDQESVTLFENIITRPSGMILITGPTGSGKTTTLYSMLNQINAITKNVITIENPVEYELDRINQIQINPHSGETFGGALKAILRQDPDVIMVGEIRDLETAEIAVQASLTGHLVLSTLHTNDAAGAIVRLTELGVPSFLTASCIVLSIAQRLIRRICPECKAEYRPEEKLLKILKMDEHAPFQYLHGKGCSHCSNTGFQGREGVFEVLKVDSEIQRAIVENKGAMDMNRIAAQKGMKTLLEGAKEKVFEGMTTVEEIKRVIAVEGY